MEKKLFKIVVGSALAASMVGCATKPDKIEAAYVSPIQYENYDCGQISVEAQRVSENALNAMGIQRKQADKAAAAVGVAVVLFWPAVFFVKGDGANEAEVARLKGQMQALEQVSNQKQCGIEFKQPELPPREKRGVSTDHENQRGPA